MTRFTLPVPLKETTGAVVSPLILKFLELVNESALATVALTKSILILEAEVILPLESTVTMPTWVEDP